MSCPWLETGFAFPPEMSWFENLQTYIYFWCSCLGSLFWKCIFKLLFIMIMKTQPFRLLFLTSPLFAPRLPGWWSPGALEKAGWWDTNIPPHPSGYLRYWSLPVLISHKGRIFNTWNSLIHTENSSFCFGSIPSFLLELFLHWSPVAYCAPTDLGSFSFSILSFCLFILLCQTLSNYTL